MSFRMVRLVHRETGAPILADWTPTITMDELLEANHGLQARNLPWKWVLASMVPGDVRPGTPEPLDESPQ